MLSGKGALNKNTNGYQVSDLDDIALCWENDQLHVDPVFRPRLDNPFPLTAIGNLEMGGSAENPILLD